MKKQFINLFFLIFFSVVPFFNSVEGAESGVLHIECTIKDVEVYINYVLEGKASPIFKKTDMVPGEIVNITLKKPEYNDLTFKAEIQAGLNKFEKLNLKPAFGFLTIQGEPSDAEIFIDDKSIGHLPEVEKYKIASGKHMLTVRKAGYKPLINKIVKVFDEEFSIEKVSLVKQGEEQLEEPVSSPQKNLLEEERDKTIDTKIDTNPQNRLKLPEKSTPSKLSSPEKKGEQKKQGVATPLRPRSGKPRSRDEVTPKKETPSSSNNSKEKTPEEEIPTATIPGMVNNFPSKTPEVESDQIAPLNEKKILDAETKIELAKIEPIQEIPLPSSDKKPLKLEPLVNEPTSKPEPSVPKSSAALSLEKKPLLEQPSRDEISVTTLTNASNINEPPSIIDEKKRETDQINPAPSEHDSQHKTVKADSSNKIAVVINKHIKNDLQFLNSPKTLTIKSGEQVEWENRDNRTHFISYKPKFTLFASYGKETDDEEEEEEEEKSKETDATANSTANANAKNTFNSPKLGEGSSWSYNFSEKGSFDYYCFVHPLEIAGTIIVE